LPANYFKFFKNKKMKFVKFTMAFIAILFAANVLKAQEYKVTVENVKTNKLVLNDFRGDLPIEGYAGNEIIVTGSSDNFKAPERAKGLKAIYPSGTDNTGIAVSYEKNGNEITLTCLLSITQSGNYKIKIPNNLAVKFESSCGRSGNISIKNMNNELDITNCQGIDLKNVTGPLVLSTISGEINVTFGDIAKDKPISIAAISGDVDITLPAKSAVDLEMSTISGNLYSDFDLTAEKDKMRRVGGGTIKTALNGGGPELKISDISGNIYLRKG